MTLQPYLLVKLLHLVAVVLFLGNATLGLFWVAHAERSRDPRLIAHAMHGIVRADRWFTWPGVLLVLGAGVAGALMGRLPLLRVGWIAGSIAMFTLSGLVFALALAPLQKRIAQLADAPTPDLASLQALLSRWHAIGWASLLPLWIAFAMMVLKVPA